MLPPPPETPHLDRTDLLAVAPFVEPSESWRLLVELTRETVRPGRYSSGAPSSGEP